VESEYPKAVCCKCNQIFVDLQLSLQRDPFRYGELTRSN
jgi:hypothetical protein